MTGSFGDFNSHVVANSTVTRGFEIALPGVAPAPLNLDTDVNFSASSPKALDQDAACTGSVANPTAPAGKICIYVGTTMNDGGYQGLRAANAGTARSRSFSIAWQTDGTNAVGDDFWLTGTWAYTAP